MRPFAQSFKDGPQGFPTFGELEGVVARITLRVDSLYEFQSCKQIQSRREDIGSEVDPEFETGV